MRRCAIRNTQRERRDIGVSFRGLHGEHPQDESTSRVLLSPTPRSCGIRATRADGRSQAPWGRTTHRDSRSEVLALIYDEKAGNMAFFERLQIFQTAINSTVCQTRKKWSETKFAQKET
jgi:hypothetical protein